MSSDKVDGVVEAVRYNEDGLINTVRVYERRGPTWSDRVIIDRVELAARLKAGKRYYAGQRIELLAGTFALGPALRVRRVKEREIILAGYGGDHRDVLEGVPLY